jgi:hypothetical protein
MSGDYLWGRRMTRFRPTHLVAAVFIVIAGALAALYFHAGHDGRAWLPNLATMFAGLGLTIVAVDWIVRRESAPRVDRALTHIRAEFMTFIDVVALDYATTHSTLPKPIPREALAMLQLWIDEHDHADLPHMHAFTSKEGTLRDAGFEFVAQVTQHDDWDRDVLDARLVAAIRDLGASGRRAEFWSARKIPPNMPAELAAAIDPRRRSYAALVQGALRFGQVLRAYASDETFAIRDQVFQWADELRAETDAIEPSVGG